MLPPSVTGDLDDDQVRAPLTEREGGSVKVVLMVVLVLQVEEATVVMEDDGPAEPASVPGTLRNLSAWNVSIPYIDCFDDEAKREKVPVFCIDVERHDRREGEKGRGAKGGGGERELIRVRKKGGGWSRKRGKGG